jgi:hypothetical protein
MRRLPLVLHGTLGSYLRDALQEGVAAAVACLPEGLGLCAYFLFFFAGGLYFLCNITF